MKHYELSLAIIVVLIALGAIATVVSINVYNRNDAPIEQAAEGFIHAATGMEIDFTPEEE